MGRFTVAEPAAAELLGEDRVRDQLSAAEELAYVGHRESALVATGAALEGALRISAADLAGPTASAGALLEALLAAGALDDDEHELLYEALAARDRLSRGFAPAHTAAARTDRIDRVQAIVVRLLERFGAGVALLEEYEGGEDS